MIKFPDNDRADSRPDEASRQEPNGTLKNK
jgi:hypothetical protein